MMNWLGKRPAPSPVPRARLTVETLEDRSVPATFSSNGVLGQLAIHNPSASKAAYVYTETNNPQDGQNAVLAFRRDGNTGALTQVGSFLTGGTGQLNVPKVIGPDDGDQEVQASADGKFLFAVNEGSGTVAAFRIQPNGALSRIGVYASGGIQPDSIGSAGNVLYVANRGDATQTHGGTIAPNVTGFNLNRDGSLTQIPNSTVNFPVNTFVTQTLVSRDHRFLFVEDATFPPGSSGTPGGNTVNTFHINVDGTLTAAPGGPVGGPTTPILLGAAQNPNYNIVYTGFTSAGQVGVFTYDETGRTNFVAAASDSGAGPCWCVVSADGRILYVANTATDSVGVFSLANPLAPVQIEDVQLGGPRSSPAGATNVFEITLDPTGRFLYAVTQSTDSLNFPQGNQLHSLSVARDGTLSEPLAPVILSATDVGANAHPQGVVAVQPGREPRHTRWFDLFGDESE